MFKAAFKKVRLSLLAVTMLAVVAAFVMGGCLNTSLPSGNTTDTNHDITADPGAHGPAGGQRRAASDTASAG